MSTSASDRPGDGRNDDNAGEPTPGCLPVTPSQPSPYTPRNWRLRRWPSFGASLMVLMLRVLRRWMPSHELGAQGFVDGTRAVIAKSSRWIPKAPATVLIEAHQIGGDLPAYWVSAPGVAQDRVILYLQGGGYIAGAPTTTYADLLWRISAACDCRLLAIEYGLAPEHRYPVASDQALRAWQFLLEHHDAASLAIAGDSAGGNLALSTTLRVRDLGLPMPAALCLVSPEADLTGSGGSAVYNARRDYVIPAASIRMIGELYAGGAALEDPYLSPVFGNFDGFPPTLLQVGGEEVFLDDARRVADKLRAAGVPVLLDIWKGMPHVWHAFAGVMPEARAAIDDLGRFVRGHLRARPGTAEVASRSLE